MNQRRSDGECKENAKKSRLHVDYAVSELVKGESCEEAAEDMEHHDSSYIIRVSPIRSKGTSHHCFHLSHNRHCELSFISCMASILSPLGNEVLDLGKALLRLWRVPPDLAPVFRFPGRITDADCFEDVFRGVTLGGTFWCAVGLEVLDYGFGIFAEWAVVDETSAGFQ